MPQLASVYNVISNCVPSSKTLLIPDFAVTESRKRAQQCISQIYACLDPRATNHAYRCMMAEKPNLHNSI
ncbi:hypothetical protein LOK49_LG11G02556 [Camellia lanceoleosa]|uniref:Uncharacterized protein n=1 Tax=Camellia lanceoleosa TaxID=1840588 RepID=A0ACC0FXS3_9ERIC|nr:hypothetical protein LOK49_LG11G02556 [Camellia lanceoleosa]